MRHATFQRTGTSRRQTLVLIRRQLRTLLSHTTIYIRLPVTRHHTNGIRHQTLNTFSRTLLRALSRQRLTRSRRLQVHHIVRSVSRAGLLRGRRIFCALRKRKQHHFKRPGVVIVPKGAASRRYRIVSRFHRHTRTRHLTIPKYLINGQRATRGHQTVATRRIRTQRIVDFAVGYTSTRLRNRSQRITRLNGSRTHIISRRISIIRLRHISINRTRR